MNKFTEFTFGKRHEGKAVDVNGLGQYLKTAQATGAEFFRSIFYFDEQILQHLKTRKSPSGYLGNYHLDNITLDIDKGKETDTTTLHRAKMFYEQLRDDWNINEDEIQSWFSGTGYHFVIPDIFGFEPANDLPDTVRKTLAREFEGIDTSFYNNSGLIRVGYTINHKTKLYKTPLHAEELLSAKPEDIFALSKQPRTDFHFTKYLSKNVTHPGRILLSNGDKKQMKMSQHNTTNRVTCMQSCYALGEEEGTRHLRIMRLASWQRRNGTPIEGTVAMIQAYAPSLDPYAVERDVRYTYDKEYEFGCNDSIMKEFCSSKCLFFKGKNFLPGIVTAQEMEKEYVQYTRDLQGDNVIDLKDVWDLEENFRILPGNLVNVIGPSGRNKTALAQNLAVKLAKKTLYISTEFGNQQLYRRFVQIARGMDKESVQEHYLVNTNHYSNDVRNIGYVRDTPDLIELEQIVKDSDKHVIIIDTVHDIDISDQPDGLNKEKRLAMELKQMAERYKVIIIMVQHTNKQSSEHRTKEGSIEASELSMYSGLGSSAFTQKSDIVIGITGERNMSARTVECLKARDDPSFKLFFNVDMKTFIFHQVSLKDEPIDRIAAHQPDRPIHQLTFGGN
ncbi:MAG: AAA family ATPase [Bacteroidetes bacterium]|nr:AAA family ATPase [Bacteroidota bacterium]